ncbi:MAG: hypothetical protein KAS46_04945 [Candidatus Aureabacteria bacterium]|nr:hypothetical protein [Candidatus Auribacterota bacterium]
MNYAFIHVADIHYRKDAPEGASSIMKAFLEDLGKQTKALPNYRKKIKKIKIVKKIEKIRKNSKKK